MVKLFLVLKMHCSTVSHFSLNKCSIFPLTLFLLSSLHGEFYFYECICSSLFLSHTLFPCDHSCFFYFILKKKKKRGYINILVIFHLSFKFCPDPACPCLTMGERRGRKSCRGFQVSGRNLRGCSVRSNRLIFSCVLQTDDVLLRRSLCQATGCLPLVELRVPGPGGPISLN